MNTQNHTHFYSITSYWVILEPLFIKKYKSQSCFLKHFLTEMVMHSWDPSTFIKFEKLKRVQFSAFWDSKINISELTVIYIYNNKHIKGINCGIFLQCCLPNKICEHASLSIVWVLFKNISYIYKHHYCIWRAGKFSPLLLWALSSEGSLSPHTCYDTGPRFLWSRPKDCPFKSPLWGYLGPILTRILMWSWVNFNADIKHDYVVMQLIHVNMPVILCQQFNMCN